MTTSDANGWAIDASPPVEHPEAAASRVEVGVVEVVVLDRLPPVGGELPAQLAEPRGEVP